MLNKYVLIGGPDSKNDPGKKCRRSFDTVFLVLSEMNSCQMIIVTFMKGLGASGFVAVQLSQNTSHNGCRLHGPSYTYNLFHAWFSW